MAGAWQKAKRVVGGISKLDSAALDREGYPELSHFLAGVQTPDGKGMDPSPHTLTLWLEGDMLHFCIQSKDEPNKIFGSVTSMNMGLDGVEKALQNESFSVRKSKR